MFKNKNPEEDEQENIVNNRHKDNIKYDEDYYNNYIKQYNKKQRLEALFYFHNLLVQVILVFLPIPGLRISYYKMLEATIIMTKNKLRRICSKKNT